MKKSLVVFQVESLCNSAEQAGAGKDLDLCIEVRGIL